MVGHVLDVCDLSVARSGKIVIKDVCLTVDEGEFLESWVQMVLENPHSCWPCWDC